MIRIDRVVLAVALAFPSASRGSPRDQTRVLYERGIAEYQSGDFNAALSSFRNAYAIEPSPRLLFNMAQVHRQRGDVRDALALYREYLRKAPNAPARADVLAIIDRLETSPRPDPHPLAPPPPAQETRVAPPSLPRAVLQPSPLESTGAGSLSTIRVEDEPRFTQRGAIGLVAATGVIGTVILGGAAGLSLRASSQSDALTSAPTNTRWDTGYQGRYDDGVAATRAATALYVVGATALAASAISAIVLRKTLARDGAAPRRLAWAF